jgi:uncharacterized protein YaiI (UPF0178 family)
VTAELTIYVDADACPVKTEVVKVAERHQLRVVLVANSWMQAPRGQRIRMQVVPGSFDAADDWIVEHVAQDDIVITSDIPLASRCLHAGARILAPSGKEFSNDNIGNALATRELMAGFAGVRRGRRTAPVWTQGSVPFPGAA